MKAIELDTLGEKLSAPSRYLLAVGLVAIATLLRWLVLPISYGTKFTTFYPAVTMAFYIAGNGPGILAIILSALATLFFFLPPYFTLELSPEAFISLLLFGIAAGLCGYFVSRMHTYRKSLIETERRAAQNKIDEANQSLSLAVDGAQLGIWRFLPNQQVFEFSEKFAEHYGFPLGVHVVSREKIVSIIHPDDREIVDQTFLDSISKKAEFSIENRVIWPNGSVHWIYAHGRPLYLPDGSFKQMDGVSIDITERKLNDLKLVDSLATIKAAFDSMNEAIVIRDTDGNTLATNDAVKSFFHLKDSEQFPETYSKFLDMFEFSTIDNQPISYPYNVALEGLRQTYEVKIQRRNTEEMWYASIGTSPILSDRNQIVGAATVDLDITERIELRQHLEAKVAERTAELAITNQKLTELSRHDALTGLHNRMACDERLRTEFERMKRTEQAYSILMLDIDLFKKVNDSCGHAVGDSVLKSLAQTLSTNLREYDFIARWGGEEFLILLPATELDQACLVAEKLRLAVAASPHPLAGTVTISVGVASSSSDHLDAEVTVMEADQGLYEAKRSGRNRITAKISSAGRVTQSASPQV
jgi:diguanylate cyclase (GGDEF)-like protein/PAS domain S-box-containing protein